MSTGGFLSELDYLHVFIWKIVFFFFFIVLNNCCYYYIYIATSHNSCSCQKPWQGMRFPICGPNKNWQKS